MSRAVGVATLMFVVVAVRFCRPEWTWFPWAFAATAVTLGLVRRQRDGQLGPKELAKALAVGALIVILTFLIPPAK